LNVRVFANKVKEIEKEIKGLCKKDRIEMKIILSDNGK
jgi:hypothetical protein